MIPVIVSISALLIGVALLLLGSGLLNTLLAIRGTAEGYDATTLGFIMSGYFVGFFIGTFLAIPVISRIGHIRTFALCAAMASCSVLLHAIFVYPYAWMILRVVMGISLVILYTVIESWLNGQTRSEERGQLFAVYMMVNLGALAMAQQFLRLDTSTSFLLFAIASMLITISLIPITWTRLPQPELNEINHMQIKQLVRIAPVAVVGALLSGLAMGAFWGMGAVYAGRMELPPEHVAAFITAAILGGALLQYPLGRYSDRHDRRKVLIYVTGAAVLSAFLLILLAPYGLLIIAAIALYGGFAFAIYPITVAHLVDHLDSNSLLSGVSGLLLIHGAGAAFGPAIAGMLMDSYGPQALPLFFMVMQFALALFTLGALRRREKDTLEHPSPFVTMVRTTPTALEMFPDEELEVAPESEEPSNEGGEGEGSQQP